ncbi:hypothetical protein [Oceanospirillum maris]|uniref:hypothetical protein n=1 Tax=Oceanospirillum maris TaxID=64977 RepID=UPI0012FEDE29|nr:hypothetical protein [Oceanospirillum maris]
MKKIMILALLFIGSPLSMAASLVNDMQPCQAWIDFVDGKLTSSPSQYDKGDIEKIRQGLQVYNQFIQQEIITPELLKASGGNESQAGDYQKQVNAYKHSLVNALENRYPQKRLFTDYAAAIDACAQKAAPSDQELEQLKIAANLMLKLATLD